MLNRKVLTAAVTAVTALLIGLNASAASAASLPVSRAVAAPQHLASTPLSGALTASMNAQAKPAISLGNYTCYWTINLTSIGRTGQPKWKVDVPVTCNGAMDVIGIGIWGLNPSGHANWYVDTDCFGTKSCDLTTAADGFDAKVQACIAVRFRNASASECKTKNVG